MTEDQRNMDVKSVQLKSQLSAKKLGSQGDLKRSSQRSKKLDSTRNVVWSSSVKRQSSDSRFNVRKEKNNLKDQETCSLKTLRERKYGDESGERNEEVIENGKSAGQQRSLLNFKFAPVNRANFGPGRRGNNRSWSNARSPVYSKEAYVQANCQFVVQEEGNYELHAVDPDLIVDWKLVEQVYIYNHDLVTCPICLETPIAAKITRCGHVYCWSCILHYLSLSEKTWRKCPICYEALVAEDLRSVVTLNLHLFAKGDKITMKLMRRKKGSIFCWPISCQQDTEDFVKWTGDASSSTSKLQMSSLENVHKNIVQREMNALEQQLQDAKLEQSGEDCFIEMAIEKLKEKEKDLLQKMRMNQASRTDPPESYFIKESKNEIPLVGAGSAMREIERKVSCVVDDEPAFSDDENEETEQKEANEETNQVDKVEFTNGTSSMHDSPGFEASVVDKRAKTTNSDFYYFYQAEDFQNIYLQPINVRCLVREYGSLEACPETICARIISIDSLTMCKELRSRYRYLSHLPVSCGFSLCELMLQPPVVSRETLMDFSEEFHKRKLQRQKKKRDERKLERKIENRRTTDMFGREIHLPSKDVALDLESFEEFPTQNGGTENNDGSNSISSAGSPNSWGTSSFASALQSKAKASTGSYRPQRARTDSSCSDATISKCEDNEEEFSVPDFATAFSDALSASMSTLGLPSDDLESKKNKKKQKGKKLLFSTGGFMKYS